MELTEFCWTACSRTYMRRRGKKTRNYPHDRREAQRKKSLRQFEMVFTPVLPSVILAQDRGRWLRAVHHSTGNQPIPRQEIGASCPNLVRRMLCFTRLMSGSPQTENVAKSTSKWVFSPGGILARRAARIIHTPACDWSELGIPHFFLPFRPPSDAHDDSTPGCRFRYNR